MKLFPKSKDERVVAEINRIYKIGFFFLTFGILLDVVLPVMDGFSVMEKIRRSTCWSSASCWLRSSSPC